MTRESNGHGRQRRVARYLAVATAISLAAPALTAHAGGGAPATASQQLEPPMLKKLKERIPRGHLPVYFEEDPQADGSPGFLIRRGQGSMAFRTGEELVTLAAKNQGATIRVTHPGSRAVAPEGRAQLSGKVNVIGGPDQHTGLKTFAQVVYPGLYAGVDLVYYGMRQALEYDFRVDAGADANAIRMAFEGATAMKIAADGSLVLRTAAGELRQHRRVWFSS
jgi:hypothetical protein